MKKSTTKKVAAKPLTVGQVVNMGRKHMKTAKKPNAIVVLLTKTLASVDAKYRALLKNTAPKIESK